MKFQQAADSVRLFDCHAIHSHAAHGCLRVRRAGFYDLELSCSMPEN